MKLYSFLKTCLGAFFTALFRIKIEGKENVPAEGAVLVCPNHISNWDPILLAAVSDRQIRFMAKSSLFKIPVVSSILKAVGAFPVNRGSADPSALKRAIANLRNGDAVGIFPQGTRYRGVHPVVSSVKSGVGMIAYRAKCDVLPVAIATKGYKTSIFKPVYIKIGKPISYGELGLEHGTAEEYNYAAKLIFDRVLELNADVEVGK